MKVIITEDNIYQFDKVVGWKVYQKPVIEQLRVSQSDWTINYTLVNGEEVEVLVKGQTESLVCKNGNSIAVQSTMCLEYLLMKKTIGERGKKREEI